MKIKGIINPIILLIPFLLLLHSCWVSCAPAIYGTVTDKVTGDNIDSVKVEVFEGNELMETIYSDSLGRFGSRAKAKSNFIFNKCESGFKLVFSKPGYIEQDYAGIAPEMNIEIKLEK